jgi:hypothetical protein
MLSDDHVDDLRAAVDTCETARADLIAALDDAAAHSEPEDELLQAVGRALEQWRDAQEEFMATVEASSVDDVSTAAMLLKMNHGVDATEARRGLPGVSVEGADQPFDVDLSGTRGTVLTTAAMDYVSS